MRRRILRVPSRLAALLLGGFAALASAQQPPDAVADPAPSVSAEPAAAPEPVPTVEAPAETAPASDAAALPAATSSATSDAHEAAPEPPATPGVHLVPSTALSNSDVPDSEPAHPPADSAETADAAQASAVVAAFHQSLRENYRKGVLATLWPDAAIFEQGYIESSRDEYAGGHLDNDLLFASSTRYEVMHREAAANGDLAWVITQARTSGTFAGQSIDLDNTETMVLERRSGQWKIVHAHWSAHPRSE